MKTIRKVFRFFLKVIKWTFIVLTGLAVVSALYNVTLPTRSKVTETLQDNEKAYIAESMNLQQKLGDDVWPGWSKVQIPVIVYNEEYAFLIGYPNPPAGWMKMPQEELRGRQWEEVVNDDFFGVPYYRQHLPDPDITPENFTVKVGDRWVATMQTKEYAAVKFYNGFKDELPPLLNAVFPYGIFWHLLMGEAENYIGGMAHEAFHAFQGTVVPHRLAECESTKYSSENYPWQKHANEVGWKQEVKLLMQAYHAADTDSARLYASRFVDTRNRRRNNANLLPEMIGYEQKREWLEGMAKYAELKIGLEAGNSITYQPVKHIQKVSGFKNYRKRVRFFNQQIGEVKRTATRPGESRFYYVGMLQALILDRLLPDWKAAAFEKSVALDELLKKAVKNG